MENKWTERSVKQAIRNISAIFLTDADAEEVATKLADLAKEIHGDMHAEIERLTAELAEVKHLLWLRDSPHPLAEPQPDKVIRVDLISCPACGTVQEADVTQNAGDMLPILVHACEHCDYIIMESEWFQMASELQ